MNSKFKKVCTQNVLLDPTSLNIQFHLRRRNLNGKYLDDLLLERLDKQSRVLVLGLPRVGKTTLAIDAAKKFSEQSGRQFNFVDMTRISLNDMRCINYFSDLLQRVASFGLLILDECDNLPPLGTSYHNSEIRQANFKKISGILDDLSEQGVKIIFISHSPPPTFLNCEEFIAGPYFTVPVIIRIDEHTECESAIRDAGFVPPSWIHRSLAWQNSLSLDDSGLLINFVSMMARDSFRSNGFSERQYGDLISTCSAAARSSFLNFFDESELAYLYSSLKDGSLLRNLQCSDLANMPLEAGLLKYGFAVRLDDGTVVLNKMFVHFIDSLPSNKELCLPHFSSLPYDFVSRFKVGERFRSCE